MAGLCDWVIRVTKDGDVAVVGDDGWRGRRTLIIHPDSMCLDTEGFSFEEKNKKTRYDCRLSEFSYKSVVTPIDQFGQCGKQVELKPSIAYFVYELIAGVQRERYPALVEKPVFDVNVLMEKYKEYLDGYGGMDFGCFVSNIPQGKRQGDR